MNTNGLKVNISLATIMVLMAMMAPVSAQTRTVGLMINDTTQSYNGYTLFAPIQYPISTTYLINNSGEMVHFWPSTYSPGLSVYLLENGQLLHTGRLLDSSRFANTGGAGGIVQISKWTERFHGNTHMLAMSTGRTMMSG
jgi:hypothetical protein